MEERIKLRSQSTQLSKVLLMRMEAGTGPRNRMELLQWLRFTNPLKSFEICGQVECDECTLSHCSFDNPHSSVLFAPENLQFQGPLDSTPIGEISIDPMSSHVSGVWGMNTSEAAMISLLLLVYPVYPLVF